MDGSSLALFRTVGFLVGSVIALVWCAAFAYGIYYVITLPMRRQERATLFLALLEAGLRWGRGPEETIGSAALGGKFSVGASGRSDLAGARMYPPPRLIWRRRRRIARRISFEVPKGMVDWVPRPPRT